MNLNPFLAALGGAFRGAAMDTEMRRRLEEAEAERKRIERAEKRALAEASLSRQERLAALGATPDTGAVSKGDLLRSIANMGSFSIPTGIGTADATGATESLLGAKSIERSAPRFELPDLESGKPITYRIDEEQTPEAKALRKLQAQQQGQQTIEYLKARNRELSDAARFESKNRGAYSLLSRPNGPLAGVPYDEVKDQDLSAILKDYASSQSQNAAMSRVLAAAGINNEKLSALYILKSIDDTAKELQSGRKDAMGVMWERQPLRPEEAKKQAIQQAIAIYGEGNVHKAMGTTMTSPSPASPPSPATPATPSAPTSPNGTAKADRWEELVRGGMSKDAATAQVKREFGIQ